jgi:hypothetical protein
MYDFFSAWREVAHVSEITGLSVGVLVALAALAWFVPLARRLAIEIAVVIVIAYVSGISCYHLASSDKQAQWAAADAAAAKIASAHDAAIGAAIEAKYMPQIASLQKQADQYQQQVASYERTIVGQKSAAASGNCVLGAGALRLRH